MKMKKVLSLALALTSILAFAGCENASTSDSTPMPPTEGKIGERVTAEEFLSVSSMCCDNFYTKSTHVQNPVRIDNYEMSYVAETTTYHCGNLICSYSNKTSYWKVYSVDSETSEEIVTETSYVEEYKFYYEKDGDNYYMYTYVEKEDVWKKTVDSYGAIHFDYGNLDVFGDEVSAELEDEIAYFTNFDNWTYLEETGEYQILDFVVEVEGLSPISFSEKVAFKDGHIVQISISYDSGAAWTVTKYFDHGQSVVELPTNIVDNTVTE